MSKNKYRITELEEILRMKQMTLKSHLEAKLEAAGYEPSSEDGFLYPSTLSCSYGYST